MKNIDDIDPELEDLVRRFFSSINHHSNEYFDVDDYIDIIEYFIDQEIIKYAHLALREALLAFPDEETILDKQAELLMLDGKPKDALLVLNSIVLPQNSMTFGLRGECYTRTAQVDNARAAFNTLIEMCNPDDILTTFTDITQLMNECEMYSLTLEFADKALALFPNDIDITKEKGYALHQLGKGEEAITLFNRIIDLDPYNTMAWTCLSQIYYDSDNLTEAIRCFDFILAINFDADVAIQKSLCLLRLEQYDEGIECLKGCIENDPNNYSLKSLLASTYSQNDQFDKALPVYKDIIDHYPMSPNAFIGYANALYDVNGDYEGALDTLLQAETIFPKSPELQFYLANFELKYTPNEPSQEVLQSNIERLKICLESAPSHPHFNHLIGMAYLMTNQFNLAYTHFITALSSEEDIDGIYVFLAVSAWKIGNKEQFKKYYSEALSRYSNTNNILFSICPDAKKYVKKYIGLN